MMLIPSKATYAPGESVEVEVVPALGSTGEAVVTHLADIVARVPVEAGTEMVQLGQFGSGGYGVTIGGASSAFDVLDSRWQRPRYGFVVALTGDVDIVSVTRWFRRLHLSAAQLYDWAYRHSQLLPPERFYKDPLGQPRDLEIVNSMSAALASAGSTPLGYAAVYAVGHDETEQWKQSLLLRASGEPYRLGDAFLVLVDPAEPRWLEHFTSQLVAVVRESAIEGFHLDQYGWPKFASRGDGTRVDLTESFVTMLRAVRSAMHDVPFIFNNVNDFPTHATARLDQNATYIEVWDPHSTLADLGALATAARASRPDHPPILSAYLHCYESAAEASCTHAATLVMATAFSHGATHLLLGENGSALVDPYYPNNVPLSRASLNVFASWYDFAVRYGDLLYGPDLADVTEFYAGGINEDVVLRAHGERASTKADPGALWLRVVRCQAGVVIHIVNLAAQRETAWDAPKAAPRVVTDASISIAFVEPGAAVYAASPDAPDMVALRVTGASASDQVNSLSAGQSGVTYGLPPLGAWTVVWIPTTSVGL
jgi:dextranase